MQRAKRLGHGWVWFMGSGEFLDLAGGAFTAAEAGGRQSGGGNMHILKGQHVGEAFLQGRGEAAAGRVFPGVIEGAE